MRELSKCRCASNAKNNSALGLFPGNEKTVYGAVLSFPGTIITLNKSNAVLPSSSHKVTSASYLVLPGLNKVLQQGKCRWASNTGAGLSFHEIKKQFVGQEPANWSWKTVD